ncbi:MAG: hypothetical protein AB7V46_15790 [Thermomicrobiales bacterium]
MTISVHDTTILAMLSRYPDMPEAEADGYIDKIEHEENVPICKAILGRMDKEELEPDARNTYDEFRRWADDRTRRARNEEWSSRRRQKESKLARNLTRLHEKGLITDQVLLMYGVSGDLPERNAYMALSQEEKEALWSERMEARFGPNWRTTFTSLPTFLQRRIESVGVNWLKEGF